MPRPRKTDAETHDITVPTATPPRVRSVTVRNRLAHPFGSPSIRVPLKNPDLVIRIVDSELRAGRVHEMTQKGWELLEPSDVDGKPEDVGFTVRSGRVVRGDRGRDVLMKMHKDDYADITAAKARANTASLGGKRGRAAVLDDVARTVGDRGDEAASFLEKRLTVTDSRGAVPELEDAASLETS